MSKQEQCLITDKFDKKGRSWQGTINNFTGLTLSAAASRHAQSGQDRKRVTPTKIRAGNVRYGRTPVWLKHEPIKTKDVAVLVCAVKIINLVCHWDALKTSTLYFESSNKKRCPTAFTLSVKQNQFVWLHIDDWFNHTQHTLSVIVCGCWSSLKIASYKIAENFTSSTETAEKDGYKLPKSDTVAIKEKNKTQ